MLILWERERMSRSKQAPTSKQADSGAILKLGGCSRSFLIVIISILAYEAVSSQSDNESQAAKMTQAIKASESRSFAPTSVDNANKQQERSQQTASSANKARLSCEYDKAPWNFCQADGSQTKVLRLKSGDRDCKPNKTIRRDCETVGCKYARGQWSNACVKGQRFRVDTLIERIGSAGAKLDCKPSRRVMKDCRRTCHYVKSAWSECVNGTRTRLLTLAREESKLNQADANSDSLFTTVAQNSESQLTRLANSSADFTATAGPKTTAPGRTAPLAYHQAPQCEAHKLIKRACRKPPGVANATTPRVPPKQTQATTSNSGAASNGASRRSHLASSSTTAGPTPAANNMKPAQKRRLKLMQARQQSGLSKSTTTVASAGASANKSAVRDRRR